ncbi:MAG: hypothetical protein Q9169_005412 [Polycauliona sp. 2 TL-2023]
MKGSRGSVSDVEGGAGLDGHLENSAINNFTWRDVTVTRSKSVKNGRPHAIISDVAGVAKTGEIMAIMGPSGSGKTTLLNVLAHRKGSQALEVNGALNVNGSRMSTSDFQAISSYVEQEDALIGSLTVRETLDFAARLSLPSSVSKGERSLLVEELLSSFGLRDQANTLVGTPIRKGISGGQKRRLSIASQLITGPKILFLDEPTNGLDSTASFEVIKYLKKVVQQHKLIVIASIHQPSTATFDLFDKLLLLSAGQTCYFGPISSVRAHMDARGSSIPLYMNPAEFLLDLTSSDFADDSSEATTNIVKLHSDWRDSEAAKTLTSSIPLSPTEKPDSNHRREGKAHAGFFAIVLALLHRSFIKSYRDVVAYGIRFAMYIGLAIMMGTVWLRLPATQSSIGPFTNAIFFGSAFMSFMAVAYVPAFLEDRATFIKERANGLYGATAFMIANFLIGIPYLFLISLIFSIITYWLNNFRPSASGFFTWVMWLFLDLLAGESLVVLMSSLFPNFVIALALTAFANGLWMSVGGFLVSPKVLNVFWRYVFHYIDYQSYVFQGMMVNEFAHRTYSCGEGCHCMYDTALASQCRIDGKGVLAQYGYKEGKTGEWVVTTEALKILRVVEKHRSEIKFNFQDHLLGGCSIDATGKPLTDEALSAAKSADAIILGAIGGPKWGTGSVRPEQGLLALRKSLSTFGNLRPCSFASESLVSRSPLKESVCRGVDFTIVRELTGGIYFGERKEDDGDGTAYDTEPYSRPEIERITRLAAHLAKARDPPAKVWSLDKANVLATSRLWRKVVSEVMAKEFPELKLEHQLIDSAAMIMVKDPRALNGIVVTSNLFGDIISDEASVIPGSLGLLPSASLSGVPDGKTKCNGIYEPIHGSAPDISGKGIVNPVAAILSTAMLLQYSLNLPEEAKAVEAAVKRTIDKGVMTGDIGGTSNTREVGDATAKELEAILSGS